MKKKAEIKRQRIIAWYLIAIVLPCLVLGILAFRGIKNDQALVERELQSELRETGQKIIHDIESYIRSTEGSLTGLLDSVPVPEDRIFTDSLLNWFCRQNPSIAGIFFISATRMTREIIFTELFLYGVKNHTFWMLT